MIQETLSLSLSTLFREKVVSRKKTKEKVSKMRRFFCCLGGENSRGTTSRVVDEVEPIFGNNHFLNHAWANNIQLPDDRAPNANLDNDPYPNPSSPPYNTALHFQNLYNLPGAIFRWQEIADGTDNLNAVNYLGRGKFGEVYRCNLPRINEVGAVKILDSQGGEGQPEYVAEISNLHKTNHPNIITLLGKCFQGKRRIVVYKFMPNGSLDYHLFGEMQVPPGLNLQSRGVDWETRMRIAVGVAEGLVYLHTGLKLIHGDVKVSNVLLDENFVPKLSDFGLATPVEEVDGAEALQSFATIMGSPGCIAPETKESGLVSTKSDIYSYGVFLLQLVTGKKAYDPERPPGRRFIVDLIMPMWGNVDYLPLMADLALGKKYSVEGIKRVFLAARMCVEPQILARPEMPFVEFLVREAANCPIIQVPEMRRSFSV